MRERVHQRFTLQRGHVTIAAMPSFASNVLPGVLREYLKVHPNIEVTAQDVIDEQVGDAVESGRVELGFGFEPAARDALSFEAAVRRSLHGDRASGLRAAAGTRGHRGCSC